ncbi:MAG: hypothetical protein HZA60_08805 [Deltaproteobacteria bacterium]|nr:hypothetical protein [Deltaproteobacteria bacterium]
MLFLLGGVRFEPVRPPFPAYDDLWVSKEKLVRLARFHGTRALKVTENEAFIWRGRKWVAVLKNSGT